MVGADRLPVLETVEVTAENKYRLIVEIFFEIRSSLSVTCWPTRNTTKASGRPEALDQRAFPHMATRSKTRKKTASKGVTLSSVPAGDRYLDLVRECPLRIIRSESEYGQAIAMLDRLSDLGNDRTSDETEYLLSLTVFVKKYEDEHHLMPPVSGVDMLRYLLETHNVTQSSLASATGLAVSTISEILAGKRKLGLKHIAELARFFGVKQAVFLDD